MARSHDAPFKGALCSKSRPTAILDMILSSRNHFLTKCSSFLLLLSLSRPSHYHSCHAFSVANNDNVASAPPGGATASGGDDGRDPRRQRVVVIGAGVGGLATAARISSQLLSDRNNNNAEVEVIVLEKNGRDLLGGRCGSFDVDVDGAGRFRHERGPSLLLLKDEYERLFSDCSGGGGTRSDARAYGLEMKQCMPAYQVVFDDGDTIQLGFPRSKCSAGYSVEEIKRVQILEQESMAKFDELESNGYEKWQDYLDTCAAFLDCGLPNFIEETLDLPSFPAFLVEALRDGGKRWPLRPHSGVLSSLFSSPKMIALASFQDLYVGLAPYADSGRLGGGVLGKTAPAVFGLLAAIELHPTNDRAGVFAPVGGFRRVAESIRGLCLDLDVKFRFETSVTAVTEEGVHYVTRNESGEGAERGFLAADLVVCNADVPFATETIAKSDNKDDLYEEAYDWNEKFDFSSGVIAFHWSTSKPLDALNTHNVFMSANTIEDAEKSWAVLRDDDTSSVGSSSSMEGKPFNFYVHRAGKTDDTACPDGCDAIMVLVPCPTLARNEDFASLPRDEAIAAYKEQFNANVVDDAREAVLQRLSVLEGLKNLQDFILDEVVDTPGSYADYYNVGAGVPFGLSHGLGQLSLTRPAAECKTNDNLLFVGASSRPGNGVPLVLIGSKQVAKKAVQKLKRMATQE